jgi:Na+/proline symporter
LKNKEKIAYIIGTIIILYGAFAGRDFSDSSELLQGVLMIALFVGIYLIFVYINKHGFGDWSPYNIGNP